MQEEQSEQKTPYMTDEQRKQSARSKYAAAVLHAPSQIHD